MTKNPVTLPETSTASEAAKKMRDHAIGAVIVGSPNEIKGLVTDRDIVMRTVAEGKDPNRTSLASICTEAPTCLDANDSFEAATKAMRNGKVRRFPVLENGKPVGILSLGDLAVSKDPDSVLGVISASAPS